MTAPAPAEGTRRRQSLPSAKIPARHQEKLQDSTRWEVIEGMSVSGCKPVFAPTPPQQQQSRAESLAKQHASALQGLAMPRRRDSTAIDTSKEAAKITSETRPRRNILPATRLDVEGQLQKQGSRVMPQPGSSMTATKTKQNIITVEPSFQAAGADVGGSSIIGFQLSARPIEQLLTRSGSAPSQSAVALTSSSGGRNGVPACQPSEGRTSALGERNKHISESEAELGRTRQDCWDESGKTVLPIDTTAKAPPDDARSTSGNAADAPAIPDGETNERLLQQLPFRGKIRGSIGWKRPQSGSRKSYENDEQKSHL